MFEKKRSNVINVYFTAGFPELNDTIRIAGQLEKSGADMIEIGMPYSDPLADGPTIQASSSRALKNGMTLEILFDQLSDLRKTVSIPVILMGYLNPALQFGIEEFAEKCKIAGIDGVIIPDLPLRDYTMEYKAIFEKNGIYNIFLIGPQTSDERIREIDAKTNGFIYVVSSYSITGAKSSITAAQVDYFRKIKELGLSSKILIGFGISDHDTFSTACSYADGAIIGSAFIKTLEQDASAEAIHHFIKAIRDPHDHTV